jgi:hypothetical protein
MVCFETKNPNFGKFWRVLQWKILVNFMTIWCILRPLEISYGYLVYFVFIRYISPVFWYFVQRKIWQPRRSPRNVILKFETIFPPAFFWRELPQIQF